MSEDQLIGRIEELERFNGQLLLEKQQEVRLEFSWSGILGHWFWDVKTNNVTFNPLKVIALGYEEAEIPEQVMF